MMTDPGVKVFRRIEKQLPLLTTIDLQYVSPKLLQSENLELAVPGTYRSGKPVVRIARFVPKLSVIASKQRPRRLAIIGSDTKEYQFCLKGEKTHRI
jgi:FKBP12-rapamycin complex-associated protein